MSFKFPQLWSKGGQIPALYTQSTLSKFKHLIKWRKSPSILEIGFASGSNSSKTLIPLLPDDYKEFIGSDISDEMVDYAKKEFKLPRSEIVKLDVCREIPRQFRERFDHIFGFHVIHMVKDPVKAFKNIKSMLKPGGSTFLTFYERVPNEFAFANLKNNPRWRKYDHDAMIPPYHYLLSPLDEYKKDLDAVQFKETVIQKAYESYTAKSEEDHSMLADLLKAANPIPLDIPDENEREEYMKEYFAEIFKGPIINEIEDKNGKKLTNMTTLNMVVYATK
ncbi:unnamed protein product [Phyllotreta striolata]|uniref:Methyltransferase type 11 domain-containing protein n=1 Tax=Phyllotreta striolata TaxID=444603 RepID=A0A9N9XR19_PHYSR|nr:unnamed protein product [Phyllotreta striolata]